MKVMKNGHVSSFCGYKSAIYDETMHRNFYWGVVDKSLSRELQAFKGCHNRVVSGKSPSIQWNRDLNGFVEFLKEVGKIPNNLEKPSLGRIDHALGYLKGNIIWEEHSINSIKRKGTKYESNSDRLPK